MNSDIERIIAEQGWNDASVLGLLWAYIAAQQHEEAVEDHFRQAQEAENESLEQDDSNWPED